LKAVHRLITAAPDIDWPPIRLLCYAIVAGFLLHRAIGLVGQLRSPHPEYLAVDCHLYMEVTGRWLSGGSFYELCQLAGP